MANVFATKNGNWSDITVWNTGSLPTALDDVFANNFTIYVDGNYQVLSLRTIAGPGIAQGGRFILNNSVSLSASLAVGAGSQLGTCLEFLSAFPSTCTYVGNISAFNSGIQTIYTINNTSTGTFNIIGNGIGATNSGVNPSDGYIRNSSAGTINMTGNIIGGGASYFSGIRNVSVGTINLVGSVSASITGQGNGILNSSTGVVNVTGDIFTSNNNSTGPQTSNFGIHNQGIGTVNILGNIFGRIGSSAGVGNTNIGEINVTGTVMGGGSAQAIVGILNSSLGVVNINGNVIGGTGNLAYGVSNTGGGIVRINGMAIGNGWGSGSTFINGPSPGVFGSQTGYVYVQGLSCGPRGQWPTAGNVFVVPYNTSIATAETSAFNDIVFITSLSSNIVPNTTDVKSGVKYNLNDRVGTLLVPSISSVQSGQPIENNIGVGFLKPENNWNYELSSFLTTNSIGERLKNIATTSVITNIISSFN